MTDKNNTATTNAKNIDLLRICIRIWPDDYEYLKASCGFQGANQMIRQIIHNYVIYAKDNEHTKISQLKEKSKPIEIDPAKLSEIGAISPDDPEPNTRSHNNVMEIDY